MQDGPLGRGGFGRARQTPEAGTGGSYWDVLFNPHVAPAPFSFLGLVVHHRHDCVV